MADDQGQGPKIASIDELVNELTKKNSSPSPPAMPRPAPPPAPLPNPPIPAPVQAAPAPAKPSIPPVGGPVKEYQSSIRTMKDDISTLKQGQKPAGVDVPRIIQPPAPPSAPVAPKPPTPGQPQQFKMPSVNLGQAEKTGPLPQSKESIPPAGKPAPVPQKSQIYAPPLATGGISGSRNRLFGIIAGAVVVFGALYWFLVLRVPEPEIVLETPTPTPVATPVVTLGDLFDAPEITMSVDATNSDTFSTSIANTTVGGGMFRKIMLKDTQGVDVSWTGLTDVPQQVLDSLGGEAVVLAYGQKEIFNSSGQLNPTASVGTRAVIVAEVRDASSAIQGITAWEPTMTEAFRQLFGLNPAQQPNPDFMDNTYQGAALRFRNFPNADRSIDVGVVSATNGKSYLVIAGSRESMFAASDSLRGIKAISSPTPTPTPSPSPMP